MSSQTMRIEPMAGALGAEIGGIDVVDLSPATRDDLHQAFLDHQVICIRDQTLTPQQMVQFARLFGEPAIYPFIQAIDGAPEVIEILKTETDQQNFGGNWHSDTSYLARPASGTMLFAHEIPPVGGDTLFANMYLAYETLSDGMKDLLSGLTGIYSSAQKKHGGRARQMNDIAGMQNKYVEDSGVLEAEHPIVRTHPETGRKSLYISTSHTVRLKGMTEEESQPLITYLNAHSVKPEFTCRVRWSPGALVLWDNRCTQHFAVNDYHGHRRRMHRVTLEGESPS